MRKEKTYQDVLDETEQILMSEPFSSSELREGAPLFESHPDPDEPEEITINRQKQMDEGTYVDDGGIPVTCPYCGVKRAIISPPCCEKAKKRQEERMKEVSEFFIERAKTT